MESELQAGRKINPELNCRGRWRHKWKPALREVEATESRACSMWLQTNEVHLKAISGFVAIYLESWSS